MAVKKISVEKLEELKRKVSIKKVGKIDLKKLSIRQINQILDGKSFQDQVIFLFRLVKSYGDPFEMLGNDLKSLRLYGIDNNTLEALAILLIYTRIFSEEDNLKKWKKELNHRREALDLEYIKDNNDLTEDHKLNIQNLEGRLMANFIADTIGTIDSILPVDDASERHIIISELFNELDIRKKEPFYTLDEAVDDFNRGNTTQPGKKAISKRIKKELTAYKKMLENTIALINTNSN